MPTGRLTPGLKAEIVTTVDDKLVVKHMGGDGVLSTPSMIGLMERAGIDAYRHICPKGTPRSVSRSTSSISEPPQKARR